MSVITSNIINSSAVALCGPATFIHLSSKFLIDKTTCSCCWKPDRNNNNNNLVNNNKKHYSSRLKFFLSVLTLRNEIPLPRCPSTTAVGEYMCSFIDPRQLFCGGISVWPKNKSRQKTYTIRVVWAGGRERMEKRRRKARDRHISDWTVCRTCKYIK